jgi:quercetin dioxygenase-like cupin family protein
MIADGVIDPHAGREFRTMGQTREQESGGEKGGEFIGKALDLQALVDYQKAAVVSKTLINKRVGTITLFAFDEGQGLSEHTAPYDAFVYIFDGEAVVTIAGTPHTVKKGDIIIMPAHKPHELRAVTKYKMMLVMIRA